MESKNSETNKYSNQSIDQLLDLKDVIYQTSIVNIILNPKENAEVIAAKTKSIRVLVSHSFHYKK